MNESSFFRFCIMACIFMIIMNFCISFMGLIDVFNVPAGAFQSINVTGNPNATAEQIAGKTFFTFLVSGENLVQNIVGSLLAIAGLGVIIALCTRTGSWSLLAVYLFGLVFWSSWIFTMQLFGFMNYFSSTIMAALVGLLTLIMIFVFAGASLGIYKGSEG